MKTIENLCKCKDVVDLIYKYVHMAFTKQLNLEIAYLSKAKVTFGPFSTQYSILYDEHKHFLHGHGTIPFFGWRESKYHKSLPIYHISIKTLTMNQVENARTHVNY